MKKILFAVLITLLFLASCARIYHSPDALVRASQHKIIAIIPPKVTFSAWRQVNLSTVLMQQKAESVNIQLEMYNWLLTRKSQNEFFVEILDIQTTNAKLNNLGYFDNTHPTLAEICEILEVDGVIVSNFLLSKPMSNSAAIASGILFGVWGPTNKTSVTIEIHDEQTQRIIWNFHYKISGAIGSTPEKLVNKLMRNASYKMPYIAK